jgi:outer membrane protein TolC
MKTLNSKLLFITILLVCAASGAQAQSGYDAVLRQIEANNTSLAALREQTEARKIGNNTGIYLSDPEVEFNYLWGSPRFIGNRIDIAVRQYFDFPTAYGLRGRIAGLQSANAELAYKAERINVLLSAKQACVELVYYNALAGEYAARLQNAERIAEANKTRFEKGDATILEYNKAQLNLANAQAETARIEAERTALLSELKQLNGGKDISFTDTAYPVNLLPADFEGWYKTAENENPVLRYISGQIEIERQQANLNRAMSLPKFSLGYMSEKSEGERSQGVTIGISIPLWENKNRVREAEAQARAAKSALEDNKVQFYNQLQALYSRAAALRQNAQKLRQALSVYNNEPPLKKAREAGEISLIDYLLEIEYYYDAMDRVLESERDYQKAFAELSAMEL